MVIIFIAAQSFTLDQNTSCVKVVKKYGENDNKGPSCESLLCFYFELSNGKKITVDAFEFHKYSRGDCYP